MELVSAKPVLRPLRSSELLSVQPLLLSRLSRVELTRLNRILIGIPIIGIMLSQSITNLIVCGQLNDIALAGSASAVMRTSSSVMMGLSAACKPSYPGTTLTSSQNPDLFWSLFLTLLIDIGHSICCFCGTVHRAVHRDAAVIAVASGTFMAHRLTFVGMTLCSWVLERNWRKRRLPSYRSDHASEQYCIQLLSYLRTDSFLYHLLEWFRRRRFWHGVSGIARTCRRTLLLAYVCAGHPLPPALSQSRRPSANWCAAIPNRLARHCSLSA